MKNLLCVQDIGRTEVRGKFIYFPEDTNFDVKKIPNGYRINASRNGHHCCHGFRAKRGEIKTIGENYFGKIIVYENIMVSKEKAERINIP
jgi:hypothetical protein